MDVPDARRLRELEQENAKLKRLLAEAHLDMSALSRGKALAPQVKREAIGKMIEQHHLSERRACRLVGLSRDAYRHPPVPSALNAELRGKIVELAHVRRRFGYRRLHDLLRPEYPQINPKRVYRLYREAQLAVRKRRKAKRPSGERQPLMPARTINEVWSMDFVADSLTTGRRIKLLTVADDFTHECVDIGVDFGISGQYVTRLLDRVAVFRGYPKAVRTDHGAAVSPAGHSWAGRNPGASGTC